MKDVRNIVIRHTEAGAVISVKAVAHSSRDRIAGVLGDCLKVTTSSAAEKGKANKAIAAILAKALGVPAKRVELISGPTNPRKEFLAAGLTARQVLERLEDAGS